MAAVEFREVTKSFGDVVAVDRLSLTVEEGEFLILVGPSGCGKTTALRMVAGLEQVTSGEILIDGKVVNDLPPTNRDIAMVFQNYALYPHMTVAANIAFPLRQQRVKKAEIRDRVAEAARLLDIEELLDRKPRELSGGQRQRVAIGRALVRRPKAFLMDEPLSNLDAKLRVQMRAELIALHRRLGITTVYVTHDQTEAMTLGDRVLVLDKGVAQQLDTPQQLYREPANTFVAGFIGSPAMNLVEGDAAGGRLTMGPLTLERPGAEAGRVLVGIRPEDFRLADGPGTFPARVEFSEQLGPETLVYFRAEGMRLARSPRGADAQEEGRSRELATLLVARLAADTDIEAGTTVSLGVNEGRVRLFDPVTGGALAAAAPAGALAGAG
ncbi:MAG TPA: ABC transporter ATP-binding protein [Gaiellaceae bacterium]|nr:ABC transporter ATP-binding protein [Gaiellaceae bacterium]